MEGRYADHFREYRSNHGAGARRESGSLGAPAGVSLSSIAALFLVFDSIGKLLQVQAVIDGTLQLGYARDVVFPLGVVLMACVALYLLPRTAVLGAVLLTGYLGGAVATHVRVASPLLTHTLFPFYVAALIWGGLMLGDARLREFLPWRASAAHAGGEEHRPATGA